MLFKSLFVAAATAVGVSGHVAREAPRTFGCGTHEPSAEHVGMSKVLAAQEARVLESGNLTARATINVNVYFHVVAASQTVANGYLTDKMVTDQIAVLNRDFAPHDVAFRLAGTDRTVNTGWARDSNEIAMKRALRKGTYKDLNLYTQVSLTDNALGYAYFPTSGATSGSTTFIRDGVSIKAQTVPGGSQAGFNLGKTGTHEVGHWLGLYHTFQGGCTGSGDQVSDTPAQASFSSGCPIGRDSCPGQAGLDPIHNYMDYSDDSCYEEFTPGQDARIHSFWTTYRA
ncbi:metalloprotease [Verticillium alfalfae VaMs.102]|uniref:Extracellular metalloprotease VDBG_01143 n=1 Tax=Verticillium alfalfae (strain VaMs.102 / ATCC MYA-4576 / FGSC 10136) TaxID=526221 RepID=MEP1_VERA1|nr:metalloprotease [Verticillium alfalfae VaMs.102]C9S5C6.1 RecName: Full=Extracellular metalloprotease VDBG_01143; Flags: Precursor [Verticillium alfalfae VaMs.102]EEY15034.1 metalloprotease [Verticillium alfalfae VaMs.102]